MEEFIKTTLFDYTYPGLFLMIVVRGVGVPLPEELILLFSGYLCYKGLMLFPFCVAVGIVAVLIVDVFHFTLGKNFGGGIREGRLPRFLRGFINPESVKKALARFNRFGHRFVFLARFTAGLRTTIFISAGVSGVHTRRFILWDGMAAMISVPLFIWLGIHFGAEFDILKNYILKSKWVLIGIFLAVIILYAIRYFRLSYKAST